MRDASFARPRAKDGNPMPDKGLPARTALAHDVRRVGHGLQMRAVGQIKAIALAALGAITRQPLWRQLATWGRAAAEAGTAGYPPDTVRRLKILNVFAYLIAFTTLIYAVQHTSMDYTRYEYVILINLLLVIAAMSVPFAHRISDTAGGLIIVVSEFIALLTLTALLGRAAGVHIQYFIAPAAAFVVFGLKRLYLIVPVIAAALVLHLVSWFSYPDIQSGIPMAHEVVDPLYVQAAITTMALIGATVYYAFSLAETAKAEIDQLLRNILPDSIVERLKARPATIVADSFDDASILFADISGFVALAIRLGAERTVGLLNTIVTEFDALADKHGVEKIKTIGDAYMAASGLPERSVGHTARLAAMAADMLDAIARIRSEGQGDVAIRIGIATGPVMAGVIGRKKFSYDIWGDAVNLASRLEGQSQPGRILVCTRTRSALGDQFTFESRGLVDIKGAGQQEVFFLIPAQGSAKPAIPSRGL
jgi:adenylate cyclase